MFTLCYCYAIYTTFCLQFINLHTILFLKKQKKENVLSDETMIPKKNQPVNLFLK